MDFFGTMTNVLAKFSRGLKKNLQIMAKERRCQKTVKNVFYGYLDISNSSILLIALQKKFFRGCKNI